MSDCSERKIDLKTMDPHLMIDSSILKPTSASKALYEFDYKNISSTKQQRNFTMNSSDNEENKTLVQNLPWIKANELKYNEVQNHRYIDLNHQEITDFVLNYKFSDYNYSESYLNKKVCLKYIDDNIQKYGNTVSVVDMRYKTGETRRVSEENVIKAIMQGRSERKKAGDKDFYYGDARLPEFKNKISLQIHHVLLKNDTLKYKKGDEVIVLVLCMPGDFVIQNCVHRKKINFL